MTQTKNKNHQSLDQGWVDITVPLSNGMAHWPSDPQVQIKRIHDMKDGDQDNLTHISMCAHSGTHMDAPCHFRKSAKTIDKMPIPAGIGKA
ncbi:MAG: cyclase family protein, partial [Thermodesulfobacteriota bacterium]